MDVFGMFLLGLQLGVVLFSPAIFGLSEAEWINVGSCRANCLTTFTRILPSDEDCLGSKDCFMCWNMCEKLQTEFWRSICQPRMSHLCSVGCQAACNFPSHIHKRYGSYYQNIWYFSSVPMVTVTDKRLTFSWKPLVTKGIDKKPNLVFIILLMSQDQQELKYLTMTTGYTAEIKGTHYLQAGLGFRLVAVSESGIVAETIPHYSPGYTAPGTEKTKNSWEDLNGYDLEDDSKRNSHDVTVTTPGGGRIVTQASSHNLDLSMRVQAIGGKLRAIASWTAVGTTKAIYMLSWQRMDCSVDSRWPGCRLPRQRFEVTLRRSSAGDLQFTLKHLTFNSKYMVQVRVNQFITTRTFFTPGCPNPSASFTECGVSDDVITLETPTRQANGDTLFYVVGVYAIIGLCLIMGLLLAVAVLLVVRRHHRPCDVVEHKPEVKAEKATDVPSDQQEKQEICTDNDNLYHLKKKLPPKLTTLSLLSLNTHRELVKQGCTSTPKDDYAPPPSDVICTIIDDDTCYNFQNSTLVLQSTVEDSTFFMSQSLESNNNSYPPQPACNRYREETVANGVDRYHGYRNPMEIPGYLGYGAYGLVQLQLVGSTDV